MSNTVISLPTGKLPAELLAQLISTLPIDDPALFLGPGVGEDAAIIEFGEVSSQQDGTDTLLAAKSDPI
ncbi:MAG: hypothetical protein OXC27_19840, partial [Caldilineaceae bacterium]|nr:hypothetical protein [Caldilineaceae bacterium]